MKLATWNVNSLKVRLGQVLDWLAANPVDVLCLQETKLRDEHFPREALARAGYSVVFAGQPTYNGVAILSRIDTVGEPTDVVIGNPGFEDPQRRLISASVGGLRVVCAYFPNGQAVGSDKFDYKLKWIDALTDWLGDRRSAHAGPPLALLGDFNIAPQDRDVHDPAQWAGQLHCSEPERERFLRFIERGFVDAFRLFDQPPKQFSWWDYRQLSFQQNKGLRIDMIYATRPAASKCVRARIDRDERKGEKPSDHAPVIGEFKFD
jgi:exodeoxyribonuclease-3